MVNSKNLERLRARRRTLAALTALLAPRSVLARVTSHDSPVTPYSEVIPGLALRFPHDEGSHPAFRTEWWYVTGLIAASGGAPLGFQVTFFRHRGMADPDNPSAFAARQLLAAHAALSDPQRQRFLHRQRAAREGFGLAEALEGRTAVWLDDWSLEEHGGRYRARVPPAEFGFDLELAATQPPLLNGIGGYSRKGPLPESASYYYSLPQLAVRGTVSLAGDTMPVTGKAWLDHEWSSSYLDARASGWDWVGLNFDDGSALMAFRIRDRRQEAFWAGATLRDAAGRVTVFGPGEVRFTPVRYWRSPRTGTRYPVAWDIALAQRHYAIAPMMNDQEEDARLTAGAVYWEGAVRVLQNGRAVGGGYLELTGYSGALRL